MRLLTKLAFVNERRDEKGGYSWSDTGDRYILRLFRDFVFHQKDEEGRAVVDFGHVIDSLAKLDVGDSETIPLCSPDGKTVLVCSYGDVRRCLENVYSELMGARFGERRMNANPFMGQGLSPMSGGGGGGIGFIPGKK